MSPQLLVRHRRYVGIARHRVGPVGGSVVERVAEVVAVDCRLGRYSPPPKAICQCCDDARNRRPVGTPPGYTFVGVIEFDPHVGAQVLVIGIDSVVNHRHSDPFPKVPGGPNLFNVDVLTRRAIVLLRAAQVPMTTVQGVIEFGVYI